MGTTHTYPFRFNVKTNSVRRRARCAKSASHEAHGNQSFVKEGDKYEGETNYVFHIPVKDDLFERLHVPLLTAGCSTVVFGYNRSAHDASWHAYFFKTASTTEAYGTLSFGVS